MKHSINLLIALLIQTWSFAQDLGKPFVQNYTPKEYRAQSQNWDVVQDDRGIMYFANTSCILEYDGENWRTITLPNQAVGRSLSKNKDGLVFVGSQATFGYLLPNASGDMQFRSMHENLPKEHQKFNDVWTVHVMDDGVYFMTDYKLFRMKHNGEFDRLWVPKGKSFFLTYQVDDQLFVFESGLGLMTLENNEFVLVDGGAQLANAPVYVMTPYIDGKMLVVTSKKGIYVYDPAQKGDKALYPLGGDLQEELITHVSYAAHKISDDRYAIGTLRNGIYIMDAKGNKLLGINQEKGLQNNQVWNLGSDEQGALWVCMNKGISRVELNTPFTYWSNKDGVGKVFAIEKFNNKIHLATGQSAFYYDSKTSAFKEFKGINNQCWTFHKFKHNGKERLLIGSQGGVYELINDKAVKIKNTQGGFDIFESKKFPNHLFFATAEGVGVINIENGQLSFGGMLGEFKEEVRSISEDDNSLYLGTYYRGVCKVNFRDGDPMQAEFTVYDTLDGLPSMKENYAKSIYGNPVFTSSKGLFRFNEASKRFVPDNRLGPRFSGKNVTGLRLLGEDGDRKVWYNVGASIGNVNLKTKVIDTTLFKRIPEMEVNAFYADVESQAVWIGGSEGLFRYDKTQRQIIPSYNVVLRSVLAKDDTVIFGGSYQSKSKNPLLNSVLLHQDEASVPVLNYDLATESLKFKFAATSFDHEAKNKYQYKLEKESFLFEEQTTWSQWSDKSEKEYTNLREGDYVFKVRAKNIYEIESEELSYRFKVMAPWYRTFWAYGLYIFVGFLLIWLIVKLNTARLKKANARLEKLVDERTVEVQKQNGMLKQQKEEILTQNEELKQQQEEIVTQRDYIEEQNKSLKDKNVRILDSIRYAQTIQEGILPFPERLHKNLTEHFVLYRPKDIVSGDFYWFEKLGAKNYFAVADCTGHGVPGAFMSMIGTAILNDVVFKSQVNTPADILGEMNRTIIKVLKQEYVDANQDGIDVGLLSWEDTNNENITIEFAGAHRPLYCFSDGVLHELKGVNKSIGGYQVNDRDFENAQIKIKKGDTVFLTTDGYADQNDVDRKKIGSIHLKAILEENATKPLDEINKILNDYLDKHQKGSEQRDDITVIGIRF